MSAGKESPVKKKKIKLKSTKQKHNRHCVIHVVKTGKKDEVTKFTENSWKVTLPKFLTQIRLTNTWI